MKTKSKRSLQDVVGKETYSIWVEMLRALVPGGRTHRLSVVVARLLRYALEAAEEFDRLYNAYREFLQALFITRRTYPIAYNKSIRAQVEEILGMSELYAQLSHLFEIRHFENSEIADKAKEVEQLLEEYAPSLSAG